MVSGLWLKGPIGTMELLLRVEEEMLKQQKELPGDYVLKPRMTPRQMLLRIIEIVSGEGISEDGLEKS